MLHCAIPLALGLIIDEGINQSSGGVESMGSRPRLRPLSIRQDRRDPLNIFVPIRILKKFHGFPETIQNMDWFAETSSSIRKGRYARRRSKTKVTVKGLSGDT